MLWVLEGLWMLHWGTHRGTEQLAGSRLASSFAWMLMMMMLPLSPAVSHLPGEFTGFLLGEGGSPCRDLLKEEGRSHIPS